MSVDDDASTNGPRWTKENLLGGMAAGLALVGRSVPALEGTTNWILRVLGSPLFWLALIVISIGGRKISRSVTEPSPQARDRPPDRYPADGGVNGQISGQISVDAPRRGVPSSSVREGGTE